MRAVAMIMRSAGSLWSLPGSWFASIAMRLSIGTNCNREIAEISSIHSGKGSSMLIRRLARRWDISHTEIAETTNPP